MPGFGPVTQGLAARMGGGGGGAPPGPLPSPGPQGMPGAQPGAPQMGGEDPVQKLAVSLGDARMAVGEMGPQRFATEGKELLRGFIGSITQLQMSMSGGQPAGPQMGAPSPMPPQGMPQQGMPPQGGMARGPMGG